MSALIEQVRTSTADVDVARAAVNLLLAIPWTVGYLTGALIRGVIVLVGWLVAAVQVGYRNGRGL